MPVRRSPCRGCRICLADPRKLIFIDEIWMKTNMSSKQGWGFMGQRVYGSPPFDHCRTSTFMAALRDEWIDAPWGLAVRSTEALSGSMSKRSLPDAQPRRHRHHGHSEQPRDRSGARGDPRRGHPSSVPSVLPLRPQSD